ncbi:MAG TPA: alpha/beta fold hydrolase [Actinophytocola sp.]|uniref:alpha/beta fold hydrolase n=1 Tax=Actinophytocola sp. TaxID=1872138 RepID=UPI002DDCEC07|nr:alpha/beta fold hydrolase [Actinophytocola sp.]HEV2779637.1 alpha/beta fold hydrolase [Actinophytocola sp.]
MPPGRGAPQPRQELRFCRSADGTRIAYARHGSGPPLVIATCWLSHLQHDWQSPVWRHFLADLGEFATVIRYDERGHGLSDWDVEDFGLEARIADIEAVVDDAGLDRFALMAMSQGGPPSIAYAARHPERISRLIFYGSYAAALRDPSPEDLELDETFERLIKVGWARPDSTFRRVFTSMMIPGASEEQMRWLDELQRVCTSPRNALDARRQRKRANVVDLLPRLDFPTLVLHSRDDRMNPFSDSRFLASAIAGARLVVLESANHILLGDEPAWPVFRDEVAAFLAPDRAPSAVPAAVDAASVLSPRELDVLRLAAEGQDNAAIARSLTLSVRTVERHLHNTYAKLGIQGKAARAAAVARLLSRA